MDFHGSKPPYSELDNLRQEEPDHDRFRDLMGKSDAAESDRGDARLVIERIRPWCIDDRDALRRFTTQPIAAFGNDTPEEIVRKGEVGALTEYLEGFAVGGFA